VPSARISDTQSGQSANGIIQWHHTYIRFIPFMPIPPALTARLFPALAANAGRGAEEGGYQSKVLGEGDPEDQTLEGLDSEVRAPGLALHAWAAAK
jgi:hypothetical protein